MITIKNVKTIDGQLFEYTLESEETFFHDAEGRLTILPALIDPHVHFRVPGADHKEDWRTAAQAAIAGGVTRVFDMPNNQPPCVSVEALLEKKALIDSQLAEAGIPLRYNLYFGADKDHLDDIGKVAGSVIGLKIYMGHSTGGLVVDDQATLERAFQIAAQHNMLVAVHAEDEETIKKNKELHKGSNEPSTHSIVRSPEAASMAVRRAIELAIKYNAQLVICHVSTKGELELIAQAKKNGHLVYAEISPHHLFLCDEDYNTLGNLSLVNPPLRTRSDQEAMWQAIHDGTVDFFGSDHAPHTLEEKSQPYGQSPSGFPGVEMMLPLLLNAHHEGRLSLEEIVKLTRINIEQIFSIERNWDVVLVDLDIEKEVKVSGLKTKCGWSPYVGKTLVGWPQFTILKGRVYPC